MSHRDAAGALALALGLALSPVQGLAQGLTGAAIEGLVRDSAGRPVPDAAVEVTHTGTGERWLPTVRADGRFVLEHVSAGGPYRVAARALGFRPVVVEGIVLASGQRERVTFVLARSPLDLEPIQVTGGADPRLGPGRTGPERLLSQPEVARIPNLQRNLANLTAPGPHMLRFEFNGWNSQLTGYQVDGGQGADLYGGGHTGRGVFGAPVPLEAIEEVRHQAAPFDVRYGQVSSGQLNVTTLRPTNRWSGSAYSVFQNQDLVANSAAVTPFTAWTAGGAAAGPLIRDRLHLAAVADFTTSTMVDRGPLLTDTTDNADFEATGVQLESGVRFQRILAEQWGLDAGTLGASNTVRPRLDLWAKISAQVGSGVLDVSQRVASGHDDGAITRGDRGFPYHTGSTTRSDERGIFETRAAWRVQPSGRWAIELVGGVRSLRERCTAAADFPRILAAADDGSLAAGADSSCSTTDIRQLVLELSEHVTVPVGRRHLLTGGLHAEWFTVEDPLLIGSQGTWQFESLDALEAGQAFQYDRTVPGPLVEGAPSADFTVWWLGWYAQDRLRFGDRVDVTLGLRADIPVIPEDGATNPAVLSSLGLTTGRPPDAGLLWSPRASVAWDATGRGTTWLRAGAGGFAGRPPYRWLTGIYRGSGGEQALLSCRGADAPAFDPVNQPEACGSGAAPVGQINVYDPDLRFPQITQVSAGVGQRLPAGFTLTADVVGGWGVSQFRYSDANLAAPVGQAAGEAGRPLYGTIAPNGPVTVARRDPGLGPVVLVDRGRGDRVVSASAGLQRSLQGGWGVDVSYRWNDAHDYQSLESSDPLLNLGGTPLEGTHAARALGRSLYHVRHRVYAQIVIGLPWQGVLSIVHFANNGTPYSYVVDGDANADGLGSVSTGFNDLVYVPRDVRPGGDIVLVTDRDGTPADAARYASLDSLIEAEPCLRGRRGQLAARNGCTNPWMRFTNARLELGVPTFGRQRVTLGVDVFNLPNLLNSNWGRVEQVSAQPTVRLLRLIGWDAETGRGIYQLLGPPRRRVAETQSRWRLQFTARYRF